MKVHKLSTCFIFEDFIRVRDQALRKISNNEYVTTKLHCRIALTAQLNVRSDTEPLFQFPESVLNRIDEKAAHHSPGGDVGQFILLHIPYYLFISLSLFFFFFFFPLAA